METHQTIRTWAEIDLSNLAHNYHTLRGLCPPDCKFLGVVKADAYGHGGVPIAQALQDLGAEMLAVACLDEAIELRRAGIHLPILCLGQTDPQFAPALLEHQITQTVGDLETGEALSAAAVRAGKTLTIHVKLDTGMGRLGFLENEPVGKLCRLPGLRAEGIFTHFSSADSDPAYTDRQYNAFLAAIHELYHEDGLDFQIYHCAASAAVLNCPWSHMGMVRPGIALYGHFPGTSLRPVMTLKSRVAAIRTVPAGSFISYGQTARLTRDSRLAVIPIGYGDGYPRGLSNRASMRIREKDCPLVGRVCMDMCMLDVTDFSEIQTGDEVTVFAGPDWEKAAQELDTIPYELLCRVSPRVPRVYRRA